MQCRHTNDGDGDGGGGNGIVYDVVFLLLLLLPALRQFICTHCGYRSFCKLRQNWWRHPKDKDFSFSLPYVIIILRYCALMYGVSRCTARCYQCSAILQLSHATIRHFRRCIGLAPRLGFCLNVHWRDGTDWCTTAVAIVVVAATLNGKRFNAIIYHFSHNNRSAESAHTAFSAQEREVK